MWRFRKRRRRILSEHTDRSKGIHMKKKLIGVCGAWLYEQNSVNFMKKLQQVGEKYGFFEVSFMFSSDSLVTNDEIMGGLKLVDLINSMDLDAIVIIAEELRNATLFTKISDYGLETGKPVFVLDKKVENCYNVMMNYGDGFEQIVRHIVEHHGCRNVCMMAGNDGNEFSEERVNVFRKVLEENGIKYDRRTNVMFGDFWDRPTRDSMERYFASGRELPEAIICANDAMAVTVCSCLHDHGYSVPEDVLVTGFDGIDAGKKHDPMITTCEPDYETAAEKIIEEILNAEKNGIHPKDMDVNFRMTRRQSCGCYDKNKYDWNETIGELASSVDDSNWHVHEMGRMTMELLDKDDLIEMAEFIPKRLDLWKDQYYCICANASLFDNSGYDDSDMVVLVEGKNNNFSGDHEVFKKSTFIPGFKQLVESEDNGIDFIVVRLINSKRKVFGYLVEGFKTVTNRKMHRADELGMFLSSVINSVVNNMKLNALNRSLVKANVEIEKMSEHDYMTGIYNRKGFLQKLDDILHDKRNDGAILSFMSIDMDGLKYINDNFGHNEGDFAICSLASALKEYASGRNSICARYGGDEFACAVVSREDTGETAEDVRNIITNNLSKVAGLQSKVYEVSASVGISKVTIGGDIDLDELIRVADTRMYEDKVKRKKQRK